MKYQVFALYLCFLLCRPLLAQDHPETIAVNLRDGTALATDIYRPPEEGPFFTILIRTPYGKHGFANEARVLARNGYAVVVQDVRGTGDSEGEFQTFVNERADGLEVLDWTTERPWSNGSVGSWGVSYSALAGLVLTDARHPALDSVFAVSGWTEGEEVMAPGGALHLMLILPWLLHNEAARGQSFDDYDINELFSHTPLSGVFASVGASSDGWGDWELASPQQPDYSKISVPVFHITSWFDFVLPATLKTWRSIRDQGTARQKLMIGPWMHNQLFTDVSELGEVDFGPASVMGADRLLELSVRWFDETLRGQKGNLLDTPVTVFRLGAGDWVDLTAWPPEEISRIELFLQSDGSANDPGGNGRLASKPAQALKADQFIYDPADPVPTLGGAVFHFFAHLAGMFDQRVIESRQDVLSYTSPALESTLELLGPVAATLFVSTTGPDTDVTAKLVHVRPDGIALNVADGIARVSHQIERRLKPGEIVEITIDLGELAAVFPEGHRLRLDISSSNFPKFDRNPNTGADPFEATRFEKATNTIHHSATRPSRLILPTVQGDLQ